MQRCIEKYLSLSKNQSLTLGIYKDGELYVFGEGEEALSYQYDIGSVSKTVTAHLILYLEELGMIDLSKSISKYIDLPKGEYPTVYELLTHTSGYGHLTPVEITVPALLRHGYAGKNVYEKCTADAVIKALWARKRKRSRGYSYSDFSYAVLGLVAERVSGKKLADLIENFVHGKLNMKNTSLFAEEETRYPKAVGGKRVFEFWRWNRENPYIAGGGLISNVADMLTYVSMQIESKEPFISHAHVICNESLSEKKDVATCIGWHTYKKSDRLWHVGGAGTFRTSVVFNKKRRMGVVALGNSMGAVSANVHYLAKILYGEMKVKKINFQSSLQEPS